MPQRDTGANQYDIAAAIDFLARWAPAGPWHLSAFYWNRDAKRRAQGRTFHPGQDQELAAWIERWNRAEYNIHFSVAELSVELGRKRAKASKERGELQACIACHVDADPVSPNSATEDCERFERLAINGNPHAGLPPATLVLRSGRGVQAFWMLDGSATVEEVEARNQWLAVQFGAAGDGTWNADRVMKLPGTIAWANSTKRAKGWPEVSGTARLLPHRGEPVALQDIPVPSKSTEEETKPPRKRSKSRLKREPLGSLDQFISPEGDWIAEIESDELRHVLLWGWAVADCTFDGVKWDGTRRYPGSSNADLQRPADRSAVLWWICCELRREGRLSKEQALDVVQAPWGEWHGGDACSWRASPQDLARQVEDAWAQEEPRARPLASGFVVPYGFEVEGDWTYKKRDDARVGGPVFKVPVTIAGRLFDPDTRDHFLEIAWGSEVVPVLREDALFGRLSWLANRNAPFNKLNMADATTYLIKAEEANVDRLPLVLSLDRTGWATEDTFLLGRHVVGPAEVRWRGDADMRTNALPLALTQQGTVEEWRRSVVEPVRDRPVFMAVLYFCAVAPLLRLLGRHGFTLNLAAVTGTGKTSAETCGMSLWGGPGLKRSWKTTEYAVEVMLRVMTDLTVWLDDTKDAPDPLIVNSTIYMVANGRTKERGSAEGEQTLRKSWPLRASVLTSSETSISEALGTEAGARARLIEITRLPLGEKSVSMGSLANELTAAAGSAYGAAGLAWVTWLVRNRGRASEWKMRAGELERMLVEHPAVQRIPDRQRVARNFAVIQLAGELLFDALALGPAPDITELWPEVCACVADIDGAERLLDRTLAWATSREPHQRTGIRWQGSVLWIDRGLFNEEIRKLQADLPERLRLSDLAVLKEWKKRGWTITDADRLTAKRQGGQVVAISRTDGWGPRAPHHDHDEPAPVSEHIPF